MSKYIEASNLTLHTVNDVAAIADTGDNAPLSVTYRYFNFTGMNVHLIKRDGTEWDIPSRASRSENFVIQAIYSYAHDVVIDPKLDYHKNAIKSPIASFVLPQIEENALMNNGNRHKRITYQMVVSKETLLTELGGSAYLTDLDVVVSVLHDKALIPKHPYGEISTRGRLIEAETNINNVERFGMAIYIISNNNKLQKHFININGLVHTVPVGKNNSLHDGVYICRSSRSATDGSYPIPDTVHYEDIEEARKELCLFESYESAVSNGDYFGTRENELKLKIADAKERELEFKNIEADLRAKELTLKTLLEEAKRNTERDSDIRAREAEQRKHNYDRDAEIRKERMERLDHQYKVSGMHSKDYYESRSYRRKDSSEFMKFLPVLISGGLAIGTLAYNMSKN